MRYSDWTEIKLGEIAQLGDGAHTKVKRLTSGIKYLTSKNIQYGKLVLDKVDHISEDDFNRLFSTSKNSVRNLQKGDVLLSIIGSIGNAYVYKDSDSFGISSSIAIIRPDLNRLDSHFLYYLLSSTYYQKLLDSVKGGSVQSYTNLPLLKQLSFKLPPLKKQKAVTSIMLGLDKKIELNIKLNDNLEDLLLSVYKEKFRKDANITSVCRADKYFDISIGKTPPRKEQEWFSADDADFVWISISNMGSCGMFISDSSEYITKEAVDKFNIKIVPDNTVLLSFKLTVGRIAITDGLSTTNEAIAHFKTANEKIVEYLYCYLKCFNFDMLGSTSSIATAVNSKIIKAMNFEVPEENTLNEFHDFAQNIMLKIKSNIRETKNLIKMRDILLPNLMSGDINLDNITLDI